MRPEKSKLQLHNNTKEQYNWMHFQNKTPNQPITVCSFPQLHIEFRVFYKFSVLQVPDFVVHIS